MNSIQNMYNILLESYGKQGWWPLTSITENKGYHPGRYYLPRTHGEIFEVYIGAILTQATNWKTVEKAIKNLKELDALSPEKLIITDRTSVIDAIKSTGYYNQKYKRLLAISEYYLKLGERKPTRHELLGIDGIGKETADSILLYAYRDPVFVVDAYTIRILENHKLIKKKEKYESVQKLFSDSIPRDFKVYQEFHALLVEHAKRYYIKTTPKEKKKKIIFDPLLMEI
ncbi:MAG: endonuclease III domain-containing protein [archaeon]